MVSLACEICQKKIEHDQDVVRVGVGKRNKGIHPRYLHTTRADSGVGVAHIDCLNIEHDEDYPEKTAYHLIQRMDESEDDS